MMINVIKEAFDIYSKRCGIKTGAAVVMDKVCEGKSSIRNRRGGTTTKLMEVHKGETVDIVGDAVSDKLLQKLAKCLE